MSSLKSLRFVMVTGLLLFAVAGFAFLYKRSQDVDFGKHAVTVEALSSSARRNERLKQEVLAVRFGLLNQYDSLNKAALGEKNELNRLTKAVEHLGPKSPELEDSLLALETERSKKVRSIEKFKRHNAVLKNSVFYLPELSGLLTQDLEKEQVSGQLVREISALVKTTLIFNSRGEATLRKDQELQRRRVQNLRSVVPKDQQANFDLLLSHAKTVVQEQQRVDPLVEDVLDQDFSAALARVGRVYNAEFSGAVAKADSYRRVLYVWSIASAFLLLLTGYKLLHLYRDLERRVQERTRELKKALGELWGEMRLAKKIQTALVPTEPTLKGCEVAATMQPTDEVGGDYYDVFAVGETEWVLIGDVSGHGVPAGLIMMMCQTAARSALAAEPELSPDQLLVTINSTLAENIKRLDENKYMTITALRRWADGRIEFAGLHQDLFVYRAEKNVVERLPQSGTWLGIVDELEGKFPVQKLSLKPQDVLLLFTDGVTEARRDGQLLDDDGLEEIFLRTARLSAEEILASILRELEGFEIEDDLSLVVIRQGPMNSAGDRSARGRAETLASPLDATGGS